MTENDPMRDNTDLSDAERIAAYGMLSDLFARELTAERIVSLNAAAKGPAAQLASRPEFAGIFARLEEFSKDPEAAVRELSGVFAFLFLGVGGRRGAPPYESVYSDDKGRTNQAAAGVMTALLAALDLKVLHNFPEPADHVAVELAVASALANSGTVEEQVAFLKSRLNSWLGDFAFACVRGDRSQFYAQVALAAKDFTATDLSRLEDSIPETKEKENA